MTGISSSITNKERPPVPQTLDVKVWLAIIGPCLFLQMSLFLPSLGVHFALQIFNPFLQKPSIQVKVDVQLPLPLEEGITFQLGALGFNLPHDFLHHLLQTLQLRLCFHKLRRQLLQRQTDNGQRRKEQ